MNPDTFTVAEAAKAVGIELGRLRGWQQHQHINFGTRGITGRYTFTMRDVRCLALMARLVDHGIEPAVAAYQATSIVDRVGNWRGAPLVAVFSHEPNVSPCLVPHDAMPKSETVIVVPLAPLFAEIEAKAAR